MKILIVDDDPTAAMVVNRVVRRFGYEADLADCAAQAWERLLAGGFQIVISDWMMPGEDGLGLCRRIRAASLPFYTYVIILTGRSQRRDLLEALTAGADDFLVKPVDPDELHGRLMVAERIVGLEMRLREANEALLQHARDLDQRSKLDVLMQIGNRTAFEARLRDLHDRSRTTGVPFSVVMCDVDHFKIYNDSLGHQRGDDILRQIAAAVAGGIRAGDDAFRYGGEEIALLLPDVEIAGAARVAERVRLQVHELRFAVDGAEEPLAITISCGVATYPDHARDPADYLGPVGRADHALYEAKRRGRNCVVRADQLDEPQGWGAEAPELPAAHPRPPIQ